MKRKILVIDECNETRVKIRKMLNQHFVTISPNLSNALGSSAYKVSFNVDEACDIESGLELIKDGLQRKDGYSVVFVDTPDTLKIKSSDIPDLIRNVDSEVEIVCMSKSDGSFLDDRQNYSEACKLVFLKKPFGRSDIQLLASRLSCAYELEKTLKKQLDQLKRSADSLEKTNYEIIKLFSETEGERTDLEKRNHHLKELAGIDELTGMHNRRFLMNRLHEEILKSVRYARPFVLMIADIDFFKNFNDNHGHLMGDLALQLVSNILKQNIRKSDVSGRYGGEEFVFILPETDLKEAYLVAEKLRQSVEGLKIPKSSGEVLSTTVSIGLSEYRFDDETETYQDFFQRADTALYEAKDSGRNRVITNPSMFS